MLQVAGETRGSQADVIGLLQETWKKRPIHTFPTASETEAWEKNWPKDPRPRAKIVYDPPAGEVRASGFSKGTFFQQSFAVDHDLSATLLQVKAFLLEKGF